MDLPATPEKPQATNLEIESEDKKQHQLSTLTKCDLNESTNRVAWTQREHNKKNLRQTNFAQQGRGVHNEN